ncbi:MAG TPA: hypothetical protein ENJ09_15090 [Planctomycetes bacterium]|nr:hypothetical protein [Planctomycetota bacterium]
MTKLILEHEGKQRSFRIGEGHITVGSGAEAKLRIASGDVAEIHCEIEVSRGAVRLTPRPGVVPVRIGKEEVRGSRVLAEGERVQIGDAYLWVAAEETETPPPDEPSRKAGPRGARTAREVGRPRSRARNRSVVHRSRPRVKRGLPAWAIVLLVLGGAGVAILVIKRGFEASAEEGGGPVWATLAAVREQLDAGSLDTAELKLNRIPASADVTPEERQRIEALRSEIADRRRVAADMVANLAGNQFLETTLKQYEERYLSGDPDPAKVRLFLLRCAEFRRRWPTHPELSWVERQERRLKPLVDLAAPPDWAAVQWEVKWIRAQSVRDYARAFSLVDAYLEHPENARFESEARSLRGELVTERKEYVEDRLQQARYEYDHNDNPSRSVWWLVNLIVYSGDPEAADRAAGFLVKIPNLVGHLEAYRRQYPDRYAAVLRHPTVRSAAKEQGLIE